MKAETPEEKINRLVNEGGAKEVRKRLEKMLGRKLKKYKRRR